MSDRERFSPSELAVVLSHYDIGVVSSAREFPRGSRKSPKLILKSERGAFLLKRRASGRDDPFKVAFTHELMNHLRKARFPVPAIVGTRDEHNSMLQIHGRIYELFEYVEGARYDESLESTTQAGRGLARYHRAIRDFNSEWTPPIGSSHDSDSVRNGLNAIPSTTAGHDSVVGHEAELLALTQELYERYDLAAAKVNELGFSEWQNITIHGDWHPGNMLFIDGKFAYVLDFDAARLQPPVVDVAYGIAQFSLIRGTGEPLHWPEHFDETRMRRFFIGYSSLETLTREMRLAIPHLITEALLAETVVPIALTGALGRMAGYTVLQMVHRKLSWIVLHESHLLSWLTD